MLIGWSPAYSASGTAFFDNAVAPAHGPKESFVKRQRYVTFHPELLESAHPGRFNPTSKPHLRLNLFDDVDLSMVVDRPETRPHGRTVYSGHVDKMPGSMAVLTNGKGIVTGLFYIPGKGLYKVLPSGNGTHRVIEVDMDRAVCGDDGTHPDLADPKMAADIPQEGMPNLIPNNYPAGCTFATNPTVLPIGVIYTPSALATIGSVSAMESLIDTVVFYNNMIYYNSGINAQMQLVYTGEVAYTEKGSMYTDLANMGSGAIPLVQTIQNNTGAVIVNMLAAGGDPVMGLGDLPGHYSMEYATFAEAMVHEMGHNLGCGHDTANGGPGVYSYSSGSRFTAQGVQYRTIMAYAPGVYTPYFSSPLATYLGTATGVVNSTDNVRTINNTAPGMAASVPSVPGLDVPTISINSPVAGAVFTGPVTVAVTAAASDTAGIAQVDFYLDSQYVGTVASSPYNLNIPLVPSGSHYLTAHAMNTLGATAFSCPVSIYVNNTLPAPWVGQDIGWLLQNSVSPMEIKYMGTLGSETYAAGVYTVNGAGDGIGFDLTGLEQDSFHFVSQPSCGFSTLSARVFAPTNGGTNAQAGLMFRSDMANDSPYVFLGWANNGGLPAIIYRSTQGGSSSGLGETNLGNPSYFQIARSGNVFTCSESPDGTAWQTVGL